MHLQGGGAPVPPTDPLVAAHLDKPRFLSLCIKLQIINVKFTILFHTKPRSPRALKSLSPYFPSTWTAHSPVMVCCDDNDGNGDDKDNQDVHPKSDTDGGHHDEDEQDDHPLTSCPSPPLRTPVTLSSSPSYVMSKSSRVAPRTSRSYYHPNLSSQLGHSRQLSHACQLGHPNQIVHAEAN